MKSCFCLHHRVGILATFALALALGMGCDTPPPASNSSSSGGYHQDDISTSKQAALLGGNPGGPILRNPNPNTPTFTIEECDDIYTECMWEARSGCSVYPGIWCWIQEQECVGDFIDCTDRASGGGNLHFAVAAYSGTSDGLQLFGPDMHLLATITSDGKRLKTLKGELLPVDRVNLRSIVAPSSAALSQAVHVLKTIPAYPTASAITEGGELMVTGVQSACTPDEDKSLSPAVETLCRFIRR